MFDWERSRKKYINWYGNTDSKKKKKRKKCGTGTMSHIRFCTRANVALAFGAIWELNMYISRRSRGVCVLIAPNDLNLYIFISKYKSLFIYL